MNPEVLNTIVNAGQALIASPAVEGVVSSLITTLFIRRGEKIKVLEALKEKEYEKVVEELLDTGRLSYVELYKCRNFLEIAKRADEMIASCQANQKTRSRWCCSSTAWIKRMPTTRAPFPL